MKVAFKLFKRQENNSKSDVANVLCLLNLGESTAYLSPETDSDALLLGVLPLQLILLDTTKEVLAALGVLYVLNADVYPDTQKYSLYTLPRN